MQSGAGWPWCPLLGEGGYSGGRGLRGPSGFFYCVFGRGSGWVLGFSTKGNGVGVNWVFKLAFGCSRGSKKRAEVDGTARDLTNAEVASLLSTGDFIRVKRNMATESASFGVATGGTPSSNIVAKCNIVSSGLICMCDRSTSMLGNAINRVRTGGVAELCSLTVGANTPIVKLISYTNVHLRRTASTLRTFKRVCLGRALTSNIVPRVATVFKAYNNNVTIVPSLASFAFVRSGGKGVFIGAPGTLRKGGASGYSATTTSFRDGRANIVSNINARSRVLNRVHSLMSLLPSGGRSASGCARYASSLGHMYTSLTGYTNSATVTLSRVTSGNRFFRAGTSCTGSVIANFVHLGNTAMNTITGEDRMCSTRNGGARAFSKDVSTENTEGTTSFIGFYSTFSVPMLALAGTANFVTALYDRGVVTGSMNRLMTTFTSTAIPGMGIVVNGTCNATCITVGDGSVNTSLMCT